MTPVRRYLDHAATSWPKPEEVVAAVVTAIRDVGAAAGRGTHASARRADAIRAAARAGAAGIAGADPARVALVPGATVGLNLAIRGIVEPGWRVVATAADHNATLRPLEALAASGAIRLEIVPCDAQARVDPDDVARACRAGARLVVFSHASNVTGTLQDADAIVRAARGSGALSIVDAAQTAGVVPLPAEADIVVAPAHKWLQGPQGAAFVAVRDGVEPRPLVFGGTGGASDSLAMPAALCDRLEAGTPDLGALAGAAAAAGWLARHGMAEVAAHGRGLAAACRTALEAVGGVRVLGDGGAGPPIVAFTVEGYDPADVAALVEQIGGIEARAGWHCAALVHRCLGTAGGGCVRVGFGPFNGGDDVRALVSAVASLRGAAPPDPFPLLSPQVPRWQV
ncbi:MAG: aminotransferase class V-fold PLP-dependent enzyme [Planctomycetaceae bacterium]